MDMVEGMLMHKSCQKLMNDLLIMIFVAEQFAKAWVVKQKSLLSPYKHFMEYLEENLPGAHQVWLESRNNEQFEIKWSKQQDGEKKQDGEIYFFVHKIICDLDKFFKGEYDHSSPLFHDVGECGVMQFGARRAMGMFQFSRNVKANSLISKITLELLEEFQIMKTDHLDLLGLIRQEDGKIVWTINKRPFAETDTEHIVMCKI